MEFYPPNSYFLKNSVTIAKKTYSHWAVKEFNLLLLELVESNGVGFLLGKIPQNAVKIVLPALLKDALDRDCCNI